MRIVDLRPLTYALAALGIWGLAPSTAQAQLDTVSRAQLATDCVDCDMSDRNMNVHFTGANFSGSDFRRSNLNRVIFDDSNFRMAQFNKAFLMESYGQKVDFSGAVFRDANMNNAQFTGSTMVRVDFEGADLSGVKFTNTDMSGSNFANVDAHGASFAESRLIASNFNNGDFKSADFSDAVLANTEFGAAMLTDAVFNGANLVGANLAFARGLTQEQISGACGSLTTQLPEGLRIKICSEQIMDTPRGKVNSIVGRRSQLVINGVDIGALLRRSVENLDLSRQAHIAVLDDLDGILKSTRPGTDANSLAQDAYDRTQKIISDLTPPRP